MTSATPKRTGSKQNATALIRSSALVRLLDDCDAAMTAAGAELWHQQRDLALQLNKLAARCRIEIQDMLAAERSAISLKGAVTKLKKK